MHRMANACGFDVFIFERRRGQSSRLEFEKGSHAFLAATAVQASELVLRPLANPTCRKAVGQSPRSITFCNREKVSPECTMVTRSVESAGSMAGWEPCGAMFGCCRSPRCRHSRALAEAICPTADNAGP